MYNPICDRRSMLKGSLGLALAGLSLAPGYRLLASDSGSIPAKRKGLSLSEAFDAIERKDFGRYEIRANDGVDEGGLMEPGQVREKALDLLESKKYCKTVEERLEIDQHGFSGLLTNGPSHAPVTVCKIVNHLSRLDDSKEYVVGLNSTLSDGDGETGFEYSGRKDDVSGRLWFLDVGEERMIIYAEGRVDPLRLPGRALGIISHYPDNGKTDTIFQAVVRPNYKGLASVINDPLTDAIKAGAAMDRVLASGVDMLLKKDIKGLVDGKIEVLKQDAGNVARKISVAMSSPDKWEEFLEGLTGTGKFNESEIKYLSNLCRY
jgi:hypothetical protein